MHHVNRDFVCWNFNISSTCRCEIPCDGTTTTLKTMLMCWSNCDWGSGGRWSLRLAVGVAAGAKPGQGTNAAHAPRLIRPHVMHAHIQIRCAWLQDQSETATLREREWERENVWLRLWPERSKFVAMTHDYVDHYDSRQATKQAILIMMIEKPFARPGSLEWCQWLEINCPSIAQKDNNNKQPEQQ